MILLLSFRLMRTSPRFVHSVPKTGKGFFSPLGPDPCLLSGRVAPTSHQASGCLRFAPPRCPKPSFAPFPAVAHNTRRYGHPLADGLALSGRPVTVFARPGPGVPSFLCTNMGFRG